MSVEIKNLTKHYGKVKALDDLEIKVEEGEVFGLLGPNGSGKTTTIHCMLALLKYEKGEIKIFGREMTPVAYDVKKDIGFVSQNIAVFHELTVKENIDYFCGLYIKDKNKKKEYVDEAVEFTGLKDHMGFYPKKLSGGLARRLNIACGIAHKPKLVVMDEPTVGVDPQSRNKILEGIVELNRRGATVIYTSHYMEEVEQICTRIAIMEKGKVIAVGTKEQLKAGINLGEKIKLEAPDLTDEEYSQIQTLPNVVYSERDEGNIMVKFEKNSNNLKKVLEYLQKNNISYTSIYSEMPTLNDVFLEITGKDLRD